MEELEVVDGSRKQRVGLIPGPALFAVVLALPLDSLTPAAHRLAAVFVWAVVGGLSLGELMFETKLAETMGSAIVRGSGAESVWGLTAVAIALGIVLSETPSNTASASFGFMLPVSTPHNAIVYGTGLVPLREMMAAGVPLDVAGAVLIWLGLRVLVPLFGFR